MLKLLAYCFIYISLMSCAPKLTTNPPLLTPDSAPPLLTPDPHPSLLYSIPLPSKYFTTDKLNQLYIVTERNEVIKYDAKGKEVFKYNNNFLEDLSHVDVTDPFNILLYYPDFLSIITLDRTMNKTGEFNLSNLNLIQVRAIGSSNDNNVWLYDELTFKLKKVARNGTILRESVDLNLQINYSPKPALLMERENAVYLNDPKFGIFIFNIFGEYDSVLELKEIDRFQVFDNQLIYKKGKQLFSYHLQSFHQKEIILPCPIRRGGRSFNSEKPIVCQKN